MKALPRRHSGFALVLVLIILALLAVVAVGFLSSMTAERTTANAYSNKVRSDMAAQAGVDAAMGLLANAISAYPDSATVWDKTQSVNSDGSFNEGTSLYLQARPKTGSLAVVPDAAADNRPPMLNRIEIPDPRKIFVLPLISGVIDGNPRLETEKSSTTDSKTQTFFDLNTLRYQGDTEGWIGSPPDVPYAGTDQSRRLRPLGASVPKPVKVPWVEMKDSAGLATGRYAFWIEDESFKVNINNADLGDPSNPHLRRDNKKDISPTDALGFMNPRDVDLLAPLSLIAQAKFPASNPPYTSASTDADSIVEARKVYPNGQFPEPAGYLHATTLSTTTPPIPLVSDQLRYLTTTNSGGLDMSRHGSQRLNLNAVVPQTAKKTDVPDVTTTQTQVDKIISTILYHAPNFPQRFYRNSAEITGGTSGELNKFEVFGDGYSVDPNGTNFHARAYLYKIAANIIDYIDTNFSPTVIDVGGKVLPVGAPTIPFTTPPWACGKDSSPFIDECAARFTGTVANSRYIINVDYYIEVWNMSAKDITATDIGPNPFIRVGNPQKWVYAKRAAVPTDGPEPDCDNGAPLGATRNLLLAQNLRDYQIDLSTDVNNAPIVFPAGCVTVLTTDEASNHGADAGPFQGQDCTKSEGGSPAPLPIVPSPTGNPEAEAQKHVIGCRWKKGRSTYTGPMKGYDIIKIKFDDTVSSDYRTDVVMGSDNGFMDGLQGALVVSGSGTDTTYLPKDSGKPLQHVYGSYLRGNWVNQGAGGGLQAWALGDPRANNEQLEFKVQTSGGDEDSRYRSYTAISYANLTASIANPSTGPLSHPYTGNLVTATLGLPNYLSTRPNRKDNPWPDFPPLFLNSIDNPGTDTRIDAASGLPKGYLDFALGADKAITPIADGALSSIGQLGDVYDPARISASTPSVARGGGRTLKIGQHDDRWDGDQSSASRQWTSWRLLDFFSIADHPDQPRLVDTYGIQQPGLINPNGVARDNGAALSAALLGFKFQPTPYGDKLLGRSTSEVQMKVQAFIDQLQTRITSPLTLNGSANTGTYQTGAGPLWERGELSELPLFGRTHSTTPVKDYPDKTLTDNVADMSSDVYDRGREELFRRMVEMITTRGSVYTVYAIGQGITQRTANGTKTYSGMQRLKVTFRLNPKKASPSTGGFAADYHPGVDDGTGKTKDFLPNNPDDVKARFAKPDHYEIQVLAASFGG